MALSWTTRDPCRRCFRPQTYRPIAAFAKPLKRLFFEVPVTLGSGSFHRDRLILVYTVCGMPSKQCVCQSGAIASSGCQRRASCRPRGPAYSGDSSASSCQPNIGLHRKRMRDSKWCSCQSDPAISASSFAPASTRCWPRRRRCTRRARRPSIALG